MPTLKSMLCSVMLGLGPQTTFLLIPCSALAGEGGSNTRKECQGRGDRGYSLLPVCSPCTSCSLPVPVEHGSSRLPHAGWTLPSLGSDWIHFAASSGPLRHTSTSGAAPSSEVSGQCHPSCKCLNFNGSHSSFLSSIPEL